MKKISYNTKSKDELTTDLASLRATVQASLAKSRQGKASKEYLVARKNIARVMTALRQAQGKPSGATSSTNLEK